MTQVQQLLDFINHPLVFFVIAIVGAVYVSWKAFEGDVKNSDPPKDA